MLTIWILLNAIIYGYKTKKWRKRSGSNNLDQGIMYSCCVAAIALTLPRIIFTSVLQFLHPDLLSPTLCESLMDISNGLYLTATYPAYFYLWLRHRAIYCHPTVQKLVGKCVIVFGWAVLFMMTGVSIAIGWAYIATDRYTKSPNGCTVDFETDGHEIPAYALTGTLVTVQFTLLALFIYPMICQEIYRPKTLGESTCSSHNASPDGEARRHTKTARTFFLCRKILCGVSDRNSEQESLLTRTIRRSFYGALASVISDVTVLAIVSFGLSSSIPHMIVRTFYNASILINNLCILSTFGNNKKILTVCWSRSNIISDEETHQDSIQTEEKREEDGSRFEQL